MYRQPTQLFCENISLHHSIQLTKQRGVILTAALLSFAKNTIKSVKGNREDIYNTHTYTSPLLSNFKCVYTYLQGYRDQQNTQLRPLDRIYQHNEQTPCSQTVEMRLFRIEPKHQHLKQHNKVDKFQTDCQKQNTKRDKPNKGNQYIQHFIVFAIHKTIYETTLLA